MRIFSASTARHSVCLSITFAAALTASAAGQRIDLSSPTGSGDFGRETLVLSNGNIVVTDCDPGPDPVGNVYLYSPPGELISTLSSHVSGYCVGDQGIREVGNGHFIVLTSSWPNAAAQAAGAVTWVDGEMGLEGTITPENSLVGSRPFDRVGSRHDVFVLTNGNYLVLSPSWDNDSVPNAGAVTWGDGNLGVRGPVSPANSLVGSSADDAIGVDNSTRHVYELANGNYLVQSPNWNNGSIANAGAATWGSGTHGTSGVVSSANSLVGTSVNDRVGWDAPALLTNGHYVVNSRYWDGPDDDSGAATWGNGETGTTGELTTGNSLYGGAGASVGLSTTALTNGHYVVGLPHWSSDTAPNVGAAVWADGTTGRTGPIDANAAFIGVTANDRVGERIFALANGNYLIVSLLNYAGGVTFSRGDVELAGTVSPENTLMGTQPGDGVGNKLMALPNGSYLVISDYWQNGSLAEAGAVTWGSGETGVSGLVGPDNSLVGASEGDKVGRNPVVVLENGNYVVATPSWDDGGRANVGAVTWADGSTGIVGEVSAGNSITGRSAGDAVGGVVTALSNGHYVVASGAWASDHQPAVGAVTWMNGFQPASGTVSASNSLVGSTTGDMHVTLQGNETFIKALPNGHYVVGMRAWDSTFPDVGAVTWGNGNGGTIGTISADTSIIGSQANDGVGEVIVAGDDSYAIVALGWDNVGVPDAGAAALIRATGPRTGPFDAHIGVSGSNAAGTLWQWMHAKYEQTHDQLVVARPADGIVSLFRADELLTTGFDH